MHGAAHLVQRDMRWAMLVVAVLAGCGAYKVAASPAPVSAENARGADETLTRTEVGCVEV